MKIVKQFSDPHFYQIFHELDKLVSITSANPKGDGEWFWGLDVEGNLCFKCTDYNDAWYYYLAREASFIPKTDFITMKRILKEFEHLLPFV